ncbi:unnamed protein product [Orchesella dallaii]|uniref:DUF243 domain-containing protein n=1 Tax=Orchesella dallaii TaxID=48710 RepID=A0ABP1RFT9_9HEXA
MVRIALLLLAGVIPVLAQYQNYQRNRFTDYGDYSGYSTSGSSEQQQQRNDFGVQQRSFFPSHYNNNNRAQQQVGNNFGASGISAPANNVNNNNNNNYFGRDRHAIVPSSLRELEESYIRSLSSSSSTTQPFLDPYSENRQTLPPQLAQGVENYSGFIANRQQFTHSHYNKNEQNPFVQQKQQVLQQQNNGNQAQSAPITYGIPLLNQQISASNSIEAQYGQKDQYNGKYYDYHQKSNVVPNFPDFSDRPPIPEEPYIPDENEGYGQAPQKLVRPTTSDVRGFGAKVNQPPIASPPSIFDPSFPEPVLQRGFIPSFGPPTKEPCKPVPLQETPGLEEQGYNHLSQQSDVPASIIPILRPEYPKDKDEYVLPDEASSDTPEEQESTRKGKVYKHISVHVPAEDLDEEVSAPKVVKVTKKPEKHLKVIFIKPPETPTPKTEVEVSPTPQHKTLVYLLSQSGGTRTPIKLVSPTPFKPTPPQVYFLRYKDPNTGASHPQPSSESEPSESESASGSGSSEREVEPTTPNPPVIKDLQSQLDPDAELLRSAPLPVIPTSAYTTFSSPGTTAFSNLAAKTTLSSPTIFTNYNTNPTFGTVAPSQISINNGNNHLDALQFNMNTFPSLQAHTNNNPLSPNYFSSIYHLYPPPTVTGASIPSQNLVSMYLNPLHQQYHHPQYQQLYQLDQSKSGTEQKSTALQELRRKKSNAKELRDDELCAHLYAQCLSLRTRPCLFFPCGVHKIFVRRFLHVLQQYRK